VLIEAPGRLLLIATVVGARTVRLLYPNDAELPRAHPTQPHRSRHPPPLGRNAMTTTPSVLFSCVHNAGRSVAAAALLRHYGGDRVDVRSAGSQPGTEVNPVVAQVLAERGLPVVDHTPTKLQYDLVEAADVVVTMSCGETCPYVPGTRYEDWPVDDPKGRDLHTVRRIVDDLDSRVQALLAELLPS
jgi:arsenate reductase (thioredoxin)